MLKKSVPDNQTFWYPLQCSWLKRMYGETYFWLCLLSEKHPHNPCETLLHPKSLVSSMFKQSSSPFWLNIHKSWDKIYTHQLASNPNLRLIENLQTQTHHRRRKTSQPLYKAQISLAQITNPPTLQQKSLPLADRDHLKGIFPKINICSMMALQKDTQKLRENTLPQIDYHPGNYFPFINAQTVIIQPNKKGCKYIYNMINPKIFNPNHRLHVQTILSEIRAEIYIGYNFKPINYPSLISYNPFSNPATHPLPNYTWIKHSIIKVKFVKNH